MRSFAVSVMTTELGFAPPYTTTSCQKFLMVATEFPPRNSAGVHRTARFARMLPEFGWLPVVLTMPEDQGELPRWVHKLRVERTGKPRPAPASEQNLARPTATRVPRAAQRWIKAFRACARNVRDFLTATPDPNISWVWTSLRTAQRLLQEERPALVYTSGPPHSTHLLGWYLKRHWQLPWVADFRDPWSRRPWGKKQSNPWGQRLEGVFEGWCVRAADVVVLNTPQATADFRQHYPHLPAEKFLTIPNGCDPDLCEVVAELLQMSPPRKQGPIRLCHAGSLYRRRDPRPVVEAVSLLRQQGYPVVFEQVGPCASEFGIHALIQERGLTECVSLVPQVPHFEALQKMAQADVLLLIQPENDLQVPGKVYEMLLFRKPIVALAEQGATADLIHQYQLGVTCSGRDPTSIAAAIRHVLENPVTGNWDQACTDFDGRRLTRELARVFEKLLPTQADP